MSICCGFLTQKRIKKITSVDKCNFFQRNLRSRDKRIILWWKFHEHHGFLGASKFSLSDREKKNVNFLFVKRGKVLMGAKGLKKINHWEKINYGAWSRKVAVNEKIWAVKLDKFKFYSLKGFLKKKISLSSSPSNRLSEALTRNNYDSNLYLLAIWDHFYNVAKPNLSFMDDKLSEWKDFSSSPCVSL